MRKAQILIVLPLAIAAIFSCQTQKKISRSFFKNNLNTIVDHYELQTNVIEQSGEVLNPRTYIDGKIVYVQPEDWTSGFFPGSMWYLYELTGDAKWKELGTKYTQALDSVQYLTTHHDVGFMIGSSYGNGLRLSGNEEYKDVIVQASRSLSTRFRPVAGVIQSWNVDQGWQAERGWECPVIIDNMMNLELLFNATKFSGDSSFYRIAVTHADNTMKNHFRPDNSTWHVVDYSLTNGSVRNKHTAQGFAHHTTWARGQSWGIYGFVVCYRETGDEKYLKQAEKAFNYAVKHINFPKDGIPYWDYEAPNIPFANRDVSAAAIMASALYEMSTYRNSEYYKGWADKIIENLASPLYKAMVGNNGYFILKHSVGSIPHGVEIDVPLNYADYYFLEALKRKKDLETDKMIKL
jgi:rhamnogalacturonyl hydrolase YesR